ncbi:MAG: CaiB/BaiF CoA-transferase family protein [Candidatus Competibacteraceae bacterium]|jgi:crotonobetainyl-CoA:carnitine CoA-transferase CaiB-like acyl-CoA transferase|nr:CaiB/BaiF CoA-transferase family protein [Candidatus Competibacteraceae bacterium]
MSTSVRPKPLHGIKVLDLTRLLPGPVATLHLADMGADVIKIEDPGVGDYARVLGDKSGHNAWLFLLVNRNKRALRLDLKQAAGQQAFLDLALQADVIVESFRPGVVDKLGIGYDTVHALNPRIVYCSITGYGQTGPYRDRAGHDLNYCGYSGVTDQIGTQDGAPAIPNIQLGDLLGGSLSAVMGILAAVIDAQQTGQGRSVDVAMTDCLLAHAIFPLIAQLAGGQTRPRGQDFLSGVLPCYSLYETADGRHMAVGALEKKFWTLCCQTLGRPELAEQHWVFGEEAEMIRAELAAIFKTQPQTYWTDLFEGVDCCVTPVLTLTESVINDQIAARNMFVNSDHSLDGSLTQFAFPIKFSEFEFSIEREAPRVGEHSEEILIQAGFSAERISALRETGVI